MELSVFDRLFDAVFVINLENRLVYCNSAALDMSGLTKEDVVNHLPLQEALQVSSTTAFQVIAEGLQSGSQEPVVAPQEEVSYLGVKSGQKGEALISVQTCTVGAELFILIFVHNMTAKSANVVSQQDKNFLYDSLVKSNASEDLAPSKEKLELNEFKKEQTAVSSYESGGAESMTQILDQEDAELGRPAPFTENLSVAFNKGKVRAVAKGGRISTLAVEFIVKNVQVTTGEDAAIEFVGSSRLKAFNALGTVAKIWDTGNLMPGELYIRVEFGKLRQSVLGLIEEYVREYGFKI